MARCLARLERFELPLSMVLAAGPKAARAFLTTGERPGKSFRTAPELNPELSRSRVRPVVWYRVSVTMTRCPAKVAAQIHR